MIKKSHVAVLLALLALGALAAAPPQLVSYQGVLKDSGGNPLTGSYAMTFAFYDAASVGTLLLTDSHPSVSVTSGLFTVILGGGTITPGSEPTLEGVFGRRSTVWLETRVGAQTLTPRVQVLSVGYAQNANLLDGSDSTAFAAVSHPHSGADITSGTVAAARGGTGLSSPGATGNLLTSNGSIWTSAAPSFLTTEVDGVVGNEVTAASNATLTRSGSGTGGSPFTLGLNLSNANSWSGAQTFGASTNFPGSGIWDSTGKVGIGVNSGLIFPLSIKATQGIAQLLTTGSTNGSVLELRNDAPSRTYLGAINFARPAGITGQIGYLETDTMLFNTNSAERMRIDSAGNVGIGTASPSLKLEVQGTQGVARITSTSSTNGSVLVLKNSTASPTYVGAINFNDSAAGQIGYLGTDAMTVKTNGAEAMRILSNGRVGIGRTDASARLDVRATASEQVAIAGWGSVIGVEGVSDPDGHASGYLGVWNGIDSYGIEASGATAAGEFTNSAAGQYAQVAYSTYKIQGSGTVSFVQNDPVHDDRVIVYASPEGDEVATYTRGTARLVNGEIRVRLGETFQWVTNPDLGLTAHLTPRGDCKGLYVETLSTSEMVVKELGGGRSDAAFDYLVYGLRIGFEESSIVQEKQHESYIPSFTSHRERYAIYPGLRAFNALERFKAMTSSVTGVAPGALDLSRAAALKAAIHE
ncbi:MAG TPA: hypothetical protein PLS53_03625, partial [Thermoanaerobaculaceae bacterium]|nr:hypothetical protein [Thermoanaerobaculaceae bacterium]